MFSDCFALQLFYRMQVALSSSIPLLEPGTFLLFAASFQAPARRGGRVQPGGASSRALAGLAPRREIHTEDTTFQRIHRVLSHDRHQLGCLTYGNFTSALQSFKHGADTSESGIFRSFFSLSSSLGGALDIWLGCIGTVIYPRRPWRFVDSRRRHLPSALSYCRDVLEC